MKLCSLFLLLTLAISAQPKDISGTWVAKMNTPMDEMEMVYRFQLSAAGKITGSQTMPMGDAPIVDGKITGDEFAFTTEQEMFGNVMKRVTKGKVTGEEMVLTRSGPQGPPPGARPPGMGPGGPGMGPGGPRMMVGPMTARGGDADAIVSGSGTGHEDASSGDSADGDEGVGGEWVGTDSADGLEFVE